MAITWNPLDRSIHATSTLSENNLIWEYQSQTYSKIRATKGVSIGKWYWEIKINRAYPGSAMNIGVAYGPSIKSIDTYIYPDFSGAGFLARFYPPVVNDIIGFALDLDSPQKTISFFKNNIPIGQTNLPTILSGELFPIFGDDNSSGATGSSITANFGATNFYYTPPQGYFKYSDCDLALLCFKNNISNKYLSVENDLVIEKDSFISTSSKTENIKILEYIKTNLINFTSYSSKSNLRLDYNLKNKSVLINNYNIPTAIKSINNFNVVGNSVLCAIKKNNKNYIFKNSTWVEEIDSSKWNTITEFNSLTKEQIGLLAITSNCDVNINFIDKTSYLTKFEIIADVAGYYVLAQESEYDILVSSNLEKIKITFQQDGTYKLNRITGTSSPNEISYLGVTTNEVKEIDMSNQQATYDNLMITGLILNPDENNVEKVISNLDITESNFIESGVIVKTNGTFKNRNLYVLNPDNIELVNEDIYLEYQINGKELIEVI